MNVNPELQTSAAKAIRALRKFRDSDAIAAFVQTVAAFIILRGTEDDTEHASAGRLSWLQLTELSGYELKTEFTRVIRQMNALWGPNRSGDLEWISKGRSDDASVELIALARDFVSPYSFTSLEDRRVLAEQYELAIDEFVRSTRYSVEFSTPRNLAEFVVHLAQPRHGERIYDPCFGLGGFLLATAHHFDVARDDISQAAGHPQSETFISGVEISPTAALIGFARLWLAGIKSPHLKVADALSDSSPYAGQQFDCILAAPPVGMAVSASQISRFRFLARSSEALFVQHVVSQLRPGGRAVVVVPDSLLFRRGPEIELRRSLLEEFTVESVWSLSPTSLRPQTQLKTSVVLIRRSGPTKQVVFVDERLTSPFFIESNKRSTVLQPELLALDSNKTLATEIKFSKSTPSLWTSILERMIDNTPAGPEKPGVIAQTSSTRIENTEPNTLKMLLAMAAIRNWLVHSQWGMGQTHALSAWRSFLDQGDIPAAHIDWTTLLQRFQNLLSEYVWSVPVENLAARRWELVAKQPGGDALEGFLQKIDRTAPGTPHARLEDVAEIFAGVRYRSTDLLERVHRTGEDLPPLVRVQDVGGNRGDISLSLSVRHPAAALSAEASNNVPTFKRLRPNDILLTASGTVANIGVVPAELHGAVPAHSLIVIRCRSDFNPIALARLLHSSPYQAALQGNASGSTIRHLRIAVVRNLTIPFLSPEHQTALSHGKVDVDTSDESLLAALTSISQESYWLTFLLNDPTLKRISAVEDAAADAADWWEALAALLRRPTQLHEQTESGQPDIFGRNVLIWVKHAQALLDVMELPAGLERYGALSAWDKTASSELMIARDEVADNSRAGIGSPIAAQRFGALAEALLSAALTQCRNIAASADIKIILLDAYTSPDGNAEIELGLNNTGIAPLRKLALTAEPVGATMHIPLLSSGTTKTWTIQAAMDTTSAITLNVHWSALLLDAEPKTGQVDISVHARPLHVASSSQVFKVNPYIAGPPIDRPEMFFGREELIQQIRRLLRTDGPSTVILLEGNRRTGKTSLLKRLLDPKLLPRWIPIYCQFQGISGDANKAGFSAQNLFRYVAKETIESLVRSGCEPHAGILEPVLAAGTALERKRRVQEVVDLIPTERPFDHFRSIVEAAIHSAGRFRLLLMLDEFDKIQEGIDNGILSPQVPENIRFLFHTYNELSGILTGYRRIKRLREEYWSVLFGIGNRIGISALDHASARQLVIRPAESIITYSPSAVDLMLQLCACQPFLLQSLASAVFDECASTNQVNVTNTIIDAAADKLVYDNENFQTIFRNYISTERRRFLTCLIDRLSEGPDRLTFELLSTELERNSVQYKSSSQLKDDIEELRDLEVIALEQDRGTVSYRLEVPLFSRWLRKNVDPESHRQAAKNEEEPR